LQHFTIGRQVDAYLDWFAELRGVPTEASA
jgi:hypothetical protein